MKCILRQTELPCEAVVGIPNLSSGGGYIWNKFDFHRAMHCNIISIVKPTRCASVSNLPASKQTAVSDDKCLFLYVQSRTHDGWKDRPKHVECHSKIK